MNTITGFKIALKLHTYLCAGLEFGFWVAVDLLEWNPVGQSWYGSTFTSS